MTNIIPKKRYGQNFLVNKNTQERVVAAMRKLCLNYDNLDILEIGPGQGDLTQHLVLFKKNVYALEIDPEAVEYLLTQFNQVDNLHLCKGDGLRMFEDLIKLHTKTNSEQLDPSIQLVPENVNILQKKPAPAAVDIANFILLSNLPFNVGSRILVDLPVLFPLTPFAVILQKEVASKTLPNSNFTFFGAWLNLFWECKLEFEIAPSSFFPKPNVVSALLVGKPNPATILDYNTTLKRLKAKEILKKLFIHPRKTLSSNLKNLDWTAEQIQTFFVTNELIITTRLEWGNYREILHRVCNFVDIDK